MNIYGLEGPLSWRGSLINLADTKGRISSYLMWNEGDDKLFRFSKPRATADSSIGLSDLNGIDYLPTNVNVPIFSARFRDAFTECFPEEATFYECIVITHGQEYTYYLCKVNTFLSLIDEQNSSVRTLEEGEKILLHAQYHDNFETTFLLARDLKFKERLVVSQQFVDFCSDRGFQISFGKPV